MSELKFGANRTSALIPKGLHAVKIISAVEVVNQSTGIPQLEVTFIDANGTTRKAWYNLQGFKRNAAKQFVNKQGKPVIFAANPGNDPKIAAKNLELAKTRVVDEEATAKAIAILEQLAADAGLDKDGEYGPSDLVGQELLIGVAADSKGKDMVMYTFHTDRLEYATSFMDKKVATAVTAGDNPFQD